MIEYYTFKHRGDALDYTDEIFLRLVPDLTVAIFYGSKISSAPKSQALLFSEILNSEEGSKSINYLASVFEECLDEGSLDRKRMSGCLDMALMMPFASRGVAPAGRSAS